MPLDYRQLQYRIASARAGQPLVDSSAARQAAVLALFVDRPETHLLFIRRADRGDPWSNHIAFPGGHIDPADADAATAALRETAEEVGITVDTITGLDNLGIFPTQFRELQVGVFVGQWSGIPPARANPAEVAEVFEVPLSQLLDLHYAGGYDRQSVAALGARLIYPIPQGTIWGVTARILHHLLGLMDPPRP